MDKAEIKKKLNEIEEKRFEKKAKAKTTWYRLEEEIKENYEKISDLQVEISQLERQCSLLRKEQEQSERLFEKQEEELFEEKNKLIKIAAELFMREEDEK